MHGNGFTGLLLLGCEALDDRTRLVDDVPDLQDQKIGSPQHARDRRLEEGDVAAVAAECELRPDDTDVRFREGAHLPPSFRFRTRHHTDTLQFRKLGQETPDNAGDVGCENAENRSLGFNLTY